MKKNNKKNNEWYIPLNSTVGVFSPFIGIDYIAMYIGSLYLYMGGFHFLSVFNSI